jgi:hypothetical protein
MEQQTDQVKIADFGDPRRDLGHFSVSNRASIMDGVNGLGESSVFRGQAICASEQRLSDAIAARSIFNAW